jgi:hypothetical protein
MQRKWLILTSVSLGSLMATLDGSVVDIALPAIQQASGARNRRPPAPEWPAG